MKVLRPKAISALPGAVSAVLSAEAGASDTVTHESWQWDGARPGHARRQSGDEHGAESIVKDRAIERTRMLSATDAATRLESSASRDASGDIGSFKAPGWHAAATLAYEEYLDASTGLDALEISARCQSKPLGPVAPVLSAFSTDDGGCTSKTSALKLLPTRGLQSLEDGPAGALSPPLEALLNNVSAAGACAAVLARGSLKAADTSTPVVVLLSACMSPTPLSVAPPPLVAKRSLTDASGSTCSNTSLPGSLMGGE